jgi:uncharacterized protein involved in outer membrane biogenesis
MMKKLLLRLLLVVVLLVILAVVAVRFFLDAGIKRGIETIGPALAKVPVKVDSVNLSLLSGSGRIQGLFVGNPEGFKMPSAILVGTASLALQPSSLLADKVVIKSINLQGPEITYETDLKSSNLKRILANLEAATGGGEKTATQPKEAKAGKKLEVDEFLISGAMVQLGINALGEHSATVALPEIHLTDLGKGPEGITAAELAKLVLQAIEKEAAPAAARLAANLASEKGAAELKGLAGQGASNAVDSVTKGIGNLFKK